MDGDRDELCFTYFHLGLNNKEIVQCLWTDHRIDISIRTVKRITRKYGLYRRKSEKDMLNAAMFIIRECDGSGQGHGYRWMHLKCVRKGIFVSQKTVRLLQQIIDPVGVKERAKKRLVRRHYHCSGPNALWHIDGYDKLKPFGICIHGCIDGFSRQVMWMEAWNTNNNPKVIAGYFVGSIRNKNGCPERVRADAGTENGHVKQIQICLREEHVDGYSGRESFIYGRSTANQRIESFWCILRKQVVGFWMHVFKQLQHDNYFVGDIFDKNLVQFCFMNTIQADIDSVVSVWNSHRIRHSKMTVLPCGRPMIMYAMPELYGFNDCLKPMNQERLQLCEPECIIKDDIPCDKDFSDLCHLVMDENQWCFTSDPYELCDLYISLRNAIKDQL